MKSTYAVRAVAAALMVVLAFASAPATLAVDGEIGDLGDTDSITDLTVVGDRITGKIDYVKDCPTYITGCEIQVNFVYKCPEIWCGGFTSQGWRTIPPPVNGVSTIQGNCNGGGDIDNYWEMQYRVRWWAATTKTVTWKGENEFYVNSSGVAGYRLIAEGAFNVTNSTGVSGYTTIETVTSTADYSPAVTAATSKGVVFRTC